MTDQDLQFRVEKLEQRVRHLEEREKDREKRLWYYNMIIAALIFTVGELVVAAAIALL